jgi:hypothetical protein
VASDIATQDVRRQLVLSTPPVSCQSAAVLACCCVVLLMGGRGCMSALWRAARACRPAWSFREATAAGSQLLILHPSTPAV